MLVLAGEHQVDLLKEGFLRLLAEIVLVVSCMKLVLQVLLSSQIRRMMIQPSYCNGAACDAVLARLHGASMSAQGCTCCRRLSCLHRVHILQEMACQHAAHLLRAWAHMVCVGLGAEQHASCTPPCVLTSLQEEHLYEATQCWTLLLCCCRRWH
jgi:hypothetical protein